jgi:hypothetical protein
MAQHPTEYTSPRGRGVRAALEHHETGSFAHHEAVALFVEGTGCQIGRLHMTAHDIQPDEPGERAERDERITPAGDDEIGRAPTQKLDALGNGGGSRRARG